MNRLRLWWQSLVSLLCYSFDYCDNCHRKLKTREVVKERIDYHVAEAELRCVHCDAVQDYFAYGANERDYWLALSEEQHPVLARVTRLFGRSST